MSAPNSNETDPLARADLSHEQRLYRDNILDHYKHPRNKHVLSHASVTRAGKNPLCGDALCVQLAVDDGKIVDIAYQGSGCAISQAAMSMLSDELRGKSCQEVLSLSSSDVTEMLGIPVGPVRMKCAMLGLRTTQEAIDDFQKNTKNTKNNNSEEVPHDI